MNLFARPIHQKNLFTKSISVCKFDLAFTKKKKRLVSLYMINLCDNMVHATECGGLTGHSYASH